MPLTRSVFLLTPLLGLCAAALVAATAPPSAAPPVEAAWQDREPPTQPTELQALLRPGGTVHLSWVESADELGISEYRVYRDGGLIGTSETTEYFDRGVAPGRYRYTVAAVDDAGNESRRSVSAEVIAR